MLDTNKIPARILRDIAQNLGYDETRDGREALSAYLPQIANMSPEKAFDCWLEWNGMIGWAPYVIQALDELRDAKELPGEHAPGKHPG